MKTSKSYNGCTSSSYNGYKNYSQWNQSLWINNDEGLYRMAKYLVDDVTKNKNRAANLFYDWIVAECGMTHTPDGVRWSKAGIRAGMQGM